MFSDVVWRSIRSSAYHTMGTAALNHEQHRLGSITPGKLADFAAYPADPLSCPSTN